MDIKKSENEMPISYPFPDTSVEVGEIHLTYTDETGLEIWGTTGLRFSTQHFFIPGEIHLGGHYHQERKELFTIALGTGRLYMQLVDRKTGELTGEMQVVELYPGVVVFIDSYVAHTFVFNRHDDDCGREIQSEMWQHAGTPFSRDDTFEMPLAIAPL